MRFTKMHGAGNDFILIETNNGKRDWSKLAIAMCHRRFGIGSDGLILVMPSKKADVRMRMFNPDGSEAEACGNGTRCLVKYAAEEGLIDARARELTIETLGGLLRAKLGRKGSRITEIKIGMGKPRFKPDEIPVTIAPESRGVVYIKSMLGFPVNVDGTELTLNLVSMGNPHAVYFTNEPVNNFPLAQIGPKVEHHSVFPRRTNFEVARVLSRSQIEVRVWERGAGETLACGTGACAVGVAAQLHGFTDKRIDINLPGGTLSVEWDGINDVFLSGPAETVFTGEWLK